MGGLCIRSCLILFGAKNARTLRRKNQVSDYWTENGLVKPQMIMVCAAIRSEKYDVLIVGPRHFDAVMQRQIRKVSGYTKRWINHEGWESGFIDQFGDFHDRFEALKLVKENGQPFNAARNGGTGDRLFSEGLY